MVHVGAKLPTKDGARHKLQQNLPATDLSQPSRNLSWEFLTKNFAARRQGYKATQTIMKGCNSYNPVYV